MRYFSPRLVFLALLALSGSVPALAQTAPQQHTIFDVFRSIFQGQEAAPPANRDLQKPRKPRKPRTAQPAPQNPLLSPGAPMIPGQPGQLVPAAPPKPTFFVQVLGDSLSLLLAQGLMEALADRPEISVVKHSKESSGLVRDDFLNWPKVTTDLLNGTEQTDIAVIMLGSNDHQPFLKDGKIAADLGSEDWTKLYRSRVEAEANLFKEKNIKLVWVGMPVMRSERFSADMSQLNEIYRDVAAQAGATYIDIWQAFTDENGQFSLTGPDINGQPAHLRTSDGIHLTKAGQRKLASFVEKEIRRAYDAKKPAPDTVTLPVTPNVPLDTGPGEPARPEDSKPAPPVKVERPIFGPITSLTLPPFANDGEFVSTLTSRKPLGRSQTTAQPEDPHPGRADDFTWPNN